MGAVNYTVFASPSPINKNKFKTVIPTQTSIEFEVPKIVPDDYMFYFWVSYENPKGQQITIQEEPAFATNDSAFEINPISTGTERDEISGADMKFYVEEIRRRNLAMLENDGEDFTLYIRRMLGQPCVCQSNSIVTNGRVETNGVLDYSDLGKDFDPTTETEEEVTEAQDPEYQGTYRCLECFGTGISGGYFPGINIRVRYGEVPTRSLKFEEQGIEFVHDFNSWTLWHPKLKERDFILRKRSGERFLVTEIGQSEWRGICMHQKFNAVNAPRTAMIYTVNDDKIITALQRQSVYGIGKWDWSLWS